MVNNGLDSVIARNKCSCMLDNLYKLDSTIVLKSNKEMEKVIQANIEKLKVLCDSLAIENSD